MPLVLQRSGLVFFHMPKTGGTWVRVTLQKAGVPCEMIGGVHAGCQEYGIVSKGFTIIRNPWSWYQSLWSHNEVYGRELWEWQALGDCGVETINTWVQRITQQRPAYLRWCHRHYLADNVTVIRAEQLTDSLINLLQEVGEQCDVDVLRSTPKINEAGSLPIMADAVKLSEESQRLIHTSEHEIFDQYYLEA